MGQSSKVDRAYDDLTEEQITTMYTKGVKNLFIEDIETETKSKLNIIEKETELLKNQLKNQQDKEQLLTLKLRALEEKDNEFEIMKNQVSELIQRTQKHKIKFETVDPKDVPPIKVVEDTKETRLIDQLLTEILKLSKQQNYIINEIKKIRP